MSLPFLSTFRARLILSIFPVVAGVVIGALLLFEWRFSVTYQHLFEEQFENQIADVTQAKNKRFDALAKVLERIAVDPEVMAAMKSGDFDRAGLELRPALENLARERLQSEFGLTPRANASAPGHRPMLPLLNGNLRSLRPGGNGQTAPFIALLDAKGNFVVNKQSQPGEGGAGALAFGDMAAVNRRSIQMPWLGSREFAEILQHQEVGYLLVETGEDRREQVREVFITPFRDPMDGTFMGAFAFGLPVPALADKALFQQTRRSEYGEILGGLFVEGKLVSSTVPEDQKETVAQAVALSLQQSEKERREILVPIAGVKHRLIYRVLNPESPFPQAAQVNFFSLAPLQAEIRDLRRSALWLGIGALLVALVLIIFISRGLSVPVSRLVTAAQEIEKGNFEVRVPVTSDELGRVSQSFNHMAAGLALQEKYRSVLHAVADRTVAERLIENREVLSGELRDVTMLFCDIRGFSALTEHMSPHDVIELLNEHMTALTEITYSYGGIVDKFVGDLIMVLFGAPISKGDEPRRAVECARAMITRRQELNKTSRHPLEIGIGLASGNVVAGCMGSDQRLSYTVLGHRVNLASRLCGIAQAGEIILDPETAAAVKDGVRTKTLPAVQLRGFSQAIEPHLVID